MCVYMYKGYIYLKLFYVNCVCIGGISFWDHKALAYSFIRDEWMNEIEQNI